MKLRATKHRSCANLLLVLFFLSCFAAAQRPLVLSGTVRDELGKPVANARISLRSATGKTSAAVTGNDGGYSFSNLEPGSYAVTATASGFEPKQTVVTLTGSGVPSLNINLARGASQQALPNAPLPPAPAMPSLQSLGFTPAQTQGNAKLQARLDKRTAMLKVHQKLGLTTLAPMVADLITGPMAKAKGRNGQPIVEPTQTNLDLHAALGSTTAALYFTTAYFAYAAPKIPGVQKKGAIRLHESLAFVHGPGMILTPILGAMAFDQEQNGEKVHGIASAHGAVATATVLAYGASIIAVSWPIHLKFWEK